MRALLPLLLVAVGSAHPDPGLLLGTWRSHEALTLEQVERAELSEIHRELFTEPG